MNVQLLNKISRDIELIPVKDFINPKSSTAVNTGLKPKGFQSATWMLCDLINGEIYQNVNYAVEIETGSKLKSWGYRNILPPKI